MYVSGIKIKTIKSVSEEMCPTEFERFDSWSLTSYNGVRLMKEYIGSGPRVNVT